MRVLHVTQASSGGVLTALVSLARSQAHHGLEVSVLLSLREDSPSKGELGRMFGPAVDLRFQKHRGMNLRTAAEMMVRVVPFVCKNNETFVHYHSTFAGAVGRVSSWIVGRSNRSFYSPHGFAFRTDRLSAGKSAVLRILEKLLHKLGSHMILVSQSEMRDAVEAVGKRRLSLIENALDVSSLPAWAGSKKDVVRVGTAARLAHQKAPWRFARLAEMAPHTTEWIWIGGGDQGSSQQWFRGSNVEVTGWMTPEQSLNQMSSIDLYVSTSLHEGLPMSVIQAQALGIPCVLSAVDGHTDIIQDGITGYLCQSDEEFIEKVTLLAGDAELRREMGERARRESRLRFDDKRLGPESLSVYENSVVR